MIKTDKMAQQVKQQLDASLEDLNPQVTRRLQQARYAAIEKAGSKKLWNFYPQAKYAMFALLVLTISIVFNVDKNVPVETTLAMESEIEMLTSNESLELLQDLEFMQWLAESKQHVS